MRAANEQELGLEETVKPEFLVLVEYGGMQEAD